MEYPARYVEGISIIEEVDDAYQLYEARKQKYEWEKAKRRRQ